MPNLLPILFLGAAAVVLGKKKKKKKAPPEPEPPEEFPIPTDEGEPPELPPSEPGEPGVSEGPPEPGKAVASGVEHHFTGAYSWKILFTEQGDYAAHYYSMGRMGPHEEVARGITIEDAISAFKFWAMNEDRRKRNLPPIIRAQVVAASSGAKTATFSPVDEGDGTGDLGN
jgi:hypothetical protein